MEAAIIFGVVFYLCSIFLIIAILVDFTIEESSELKDCLDIYLTKAKIIFGIVIFLIPVVNIIYYTLLIRFLQSTETGFLVDDGSILINNKFIFGIRNRTK